MSSISGPRSIDHTVRFGIAGREPRVSLAGTVREGSGRAARAFKPERMAEIRKLFGLRVVAGTLNVSVPNLRLAIELLGEPDALTEHETKIGPLRWWRATIQAHATGPVPCLVVRGMASRTSYLEVVAALHFRDRGVRTGDRIHLTRRSR